MGSWDLGFRCYHDSIFISRDDKHFFKEKNEFPASRLAISCKHTDFFLNLPNTSTYLRNCRRKVPFFLGKGEENAVFSYTPFYSQKGSKNITCPVKWLINQRPKMYGAKFC